MATEKQIERLRAWGYPGDAEACGVELARDAIYAARQWGLAHLVSEEWVGQQEGWISGYIDGPITYSIRLAYTIREGYRWPWEHLEYTEESLQRRVQARTREKARAAERARARVAWKGLDLPTRIAKKRDRGGADLVAIYTLQRVCSGGTVPPRELLTEDEWQKVEALCERMHIALPVAEQVELP